MIRTEEKMDDRITIIEGPPPVFEHVDDGWAMGLNEGPSFYGLALTRLRTFNGQALVERCHRAWSQKEPIFLHYRNTLGLEEKVPILAARSAEMDGGQVLLLWIRKPDSEFDDDEFSDDLDEGEDMDGPEDGLN
jgi:hypothetical protein